MEKKEKKKVVRKKKIPKKHIVVFQNNDEKVLKTVFVNDGESVEAPEMEEILEEKEHHRIVFKGWNQDLTEVRSNLVVSPIYKEIPQEYLIMYFHENGKILGTETVAYGEDAKKEIRPEKPETEEFMYHFVGWTCDLCHIDKDQMAKAIFQEERKSFHVYFYGDQNRLVKDELVYYGEKAHAPDNIRKEADKTFTYHFDGWDTDFSQIRAEESVHALFRSEYIDYRVRFFEEGKLLKEEDYHYNDHLIYPELWKKGYDFIWQNPESYVKESMDFHGHWEYSNPKGKRIAKDQGVYEIWNPSTTAGSVRCVSYSSEDEIIQIPSKIKLGDYFYEVEEIGTKAFETCKNVRKIICPDSVRKIDTKCFANKGKIESIILGKNFKEIGSYAFAGCGHLNKIELHGRALKKISKDTFEKMNSRVQLLVLPEEKKRLEGLLRRAINQKSLTIKNF